MIARAIGVVMILPSFRMSLIGRLTVIASFLLAAQPAAAQLSPTSKWQIDSSGPMCVLHREYGTPKKRFTLELKAVPTTTQMILYVFDDEAGADRVFSPAIVSFGPNSLVAQTRLETYRARREVIASIRCSSVARKLTGRRLRTGFRFQRAAI